MKTMMEKSIAAGTIVSLLALISPVAAFAAVQPVDNPPLTQSCGLDIALVIDSSGSVDGTELQQTKDAFNGFVDALLPDSTEMAVVEFDTSATVTQGFTSNVTDLHNAINGASSGGNTNWDDALFEARMLFPNRAGNPDLIIFASDGNPNRHGGHTALGHSGSVTSVGNDLDPAIEEANEAKTAGIHITALGIGNNLNTSNLEDISGPGDVITSDFDNLGQTLADLADQLCDEPEQEPVNDTVINKNSAVVVNEVEVGANTGDNGASGAVGGDGGNGGNINNNDGDDVDGSTTGNGGAGGDASGGGTVITGNATASASVVNVVNTNVTRINRCACGDGAPGDTFTMNRNKAVVLNGVGAGANSGENGAGGAGGGSGGEGGDINNNGDDYEIELLNNEGGGADVDESDTGNGGAGGNAGQGGFVLTGNATAVAGTLNVVNRNETRIRR